MPKATYTQARKAREYERTHTKPLEKIIKDLQEEVRKKVLAVKNKE